MYVCICVCECVYVYVCMYNRMLKLIADMVLVIINQNKKYLRLIVSKVCDVRSQQIN